ncbi:hypothetical protein Tco_0771782 [Tanacetum coccineum]|uniref:Uncharacterized protein n=1 Tax=Tanacetum coccineum TaxID=301880 RepID=A0ABQ4ZIM3_9ASTR
MLSLKILPSTSLLFINSASTNQDGEMEIIATIDGRLKTVTEASIQRHLKLEDFASINSLPNAEIFEQLALMGTSKGYTGVDIALFPIMLVQGQTLQGEAAPSTSQPPSTTPITTPEPHQSPKTPHSSPTMPTPQEVEEPAIMPHDLPLPTAHTLGSDEGSMTLSLLTVTCTNLSNKVTSLETELAQTKQTYGIALTKLIKKVKKLEQTVKSTQARRRTRIVISEGEEEIPEKTSGDTEILLQEEEPTELVEDLGSGEKGNEVSTAKAKLSITAPELSTAAPEVSTAARQVYIRRSLLKRKDKGKTIMQEDESVQKKSKKRLEQERLRYEEALRLQEQIDEEERQRIARVAEIVKQLQEDINKTRQEQERQEVVTEADPTHVIDWSDPVVIRYHAQQNRAFSVVEVWDQIHSFVPMDSELEIPKLKRAESVKKPSTKEEKKKDDSSKSAEGRRKKTLARKRASGKDSEDSMKRQKLEDDVEKENLQEYMTIVLKEGMNVEALLTKYPLINWEIYTENSRVYWKIIRVGDHTEMYQFFDVMLKNFDKEDLVNLWKLVKDRFSSTDPIDDKDKALWVELKRIFEPDTDDLLELQKHMHDPLTWQLYASSGIHHVFTETGLDMFMLVENDYPLTRGLAMLMLVNKLQVDQHSKMADELLQKIFILANRPRE